MNRYVKVKALKTVVKTGPAAAVRSQGVDLEEGITCTSHAEIVFMSCGGIHFMSHKGTTLVRKGDAHVTQSVTIMACTRQKFVSHRCIEG